MRQLERHYFAQALCPQAELRSDWAEAIAASLRVPVFLISYREALFRRIRRNYIWMYGILLLAWGLKISSPKLQADERPAEFVGNLHQLMVNAHLGPVHGSIVLVAVAVSMPHSQSRCSIPNPTTANSPMVRCMSDRSVQDKLAFERTPFAGRNHLLVDVGHRVDRPLDLVLPEAQEAAHLREFGARS